MSTSGFTTAHSADVEVFYLSQEAGPKFLIYLTDNIEASIILSEFTQFVPDFCITLIVKSCPTSVGA